MPNVMPKPPMWWPGINPLWRRGMVFACPMWHAMYTGSGNRPLAEDLVTRAISTVGTSNGGSWSYGPYGQQLIQTGHGNSPFWLNAHNVVMPLTVMVFTGPSTIAGRYAISIGAPSVEANAGIRIAADVDATFSTRLSVVIRDTADTKIFHVANTLSETEDNVIVAAVHDGGAGNQYAAYMANSKSGKSTSWTTRAPGTMNRIGFSRTDGNYTWTASGIYCTAVWDYLMSIEQTGELNADPFCWCRPKTRTWFVASGAAVKIPHMMHSYRQRRIA